MVRLKELPSALARLIGGVALSACVTVGGGEPPFDVAGRYQGILEIADDQVTSSITVVQEGRRVEAELITPDIVARGRGDVAGAGFQIDLEYGDECRGYITLSGRRVTPDQLVGSIRIRDCTGRVAGSFTFDRR